jgi:hypothetical protein
MLVVAWKVFTHIFSFRKIIFSQNGWMAEWFMERCFKSESISLLTMVDRRPCLATQQHINFGLTKLGFEQFTIKTLKALKPREKKSVVKINKFSKRRN